MDARQASRMADALLRGTAYNGPKAGKPHKWGRAVRVQRPKPETPRPITHGLAVRRFAANQPTQVGELGLTHFASVS